MARTITINPVTRIEGHAKITICLNDQGRVADTMFHVTQFRGFEKFVEGRPLREMPSIMARICGICPVSHLMASGKACDDLLAVEIPATAAKLRQMMNLAQLVQSHALSFFHLSSPDLLLGMDADPAERNIFGLMDKFPDFARDGIQLRKFGQDLIARLGGKRIHPAWVVPGGVSDPLDEKDRDEVLASVPAALAMAHRALDWLKDNAHHFQDEIEAFANFDTMFLGLVSPQGDLELYDGPMRFSNSRGEVVREIHDHRQYGESIAEHVEPWTYLKFPFYRPLGYADGIYRVGPLARLVVADRCGTPHADRELSELRLRIGRAPGSSFYYHWARLIETIYGIERIESLLRQPDILDPHVKAVAGVNRLEGVGVSEAPRGTLIHHYRIDRNGLMRWANLIIATGHNNLALNRGVKQVAERFVDGDHLQEGMLNRVEAVVRAFDPCLSCSTHAWGKMQLLIELRNQQGQLLDQLCRD
jgi:NAD-reducing hydrogenase large subunit